MNHIKILYEDENFIAINKPTGLLVHRTKISSEESDFALQKVRDLVGKKVYPIHRLDRPTSGVLLFGFNANAAFEMQKIFSNHQVNKKYIALVRGWFEHGYFELNNPVKNSKNKLVEAQTLFRTIDRIELPIPTPPFETTRLTFLEVEPITGKWHQIRQHLAHLRHYIVNDRVHGTSAPNKMFTEKMGISEMFLHAIQLTFKSPFTGTDINIQADYPIHWYKLDDLRKTFSKLS